MASKVVEADAGVHSLSMAVAVRNVWFRIMSFRIGLTFSLLISHSR